jgi:hypothetical protein
MPAVTRRSRRLLAVAVLLVSLLARPRPVFACSCAPPDAPPIAFSRAEAVFSGTVIWVNSLDGLPLLRDLGRSLPRLYSAFPSNGQVFLLVTDSWKGLTTTSVTLPAGSGWRLCGYPFVIGGQYLIYAATGAAGLGTSLCSRTTDLASAAVDLAYLGTLPPLTLTPALPWPLYLCLASAVGALAFAIWAVRRKAKLRARRTAS